MELLTALPVTEYSARHCIVPAIGWCGCMYYIIIIEHIVIRIIIVDVLSVVTTHCLCCYRPFQLALCKLIIIYSCVI